MRSAIQTLWMMRKTERDVSVKQDKSTSAFLRKMEERRGEREHKLAGGEVIVSHQRSLKDRHTSAKEAVSWQAEKETQPLIKMMTLSPQLKTLKELKEKTVPVFCPAGCQSNLPLLEWNPGHQWGQRIFSPAWRGFLSPKEIKIKGICDGTVFSTHTPKQGCPHAWTCKQEHLRTLCSIASRLLLSFKKLSFSRWACWVIWAACFFRVESRS